MPAKILTIAIAIAAFALSACNGASPPEAAGQNAALPAMQSGPVSTGPAGLGPAGSSSALGSGNLAAPGALPGATPLAASPGTP